MIAMTATAREPIPAGAPVDFTPLQVRQETRPEIAFTIRREPGDPLRCTLVEAETTYALDAEALDASMTPEAQAEVRRVLDGMPNPGLRLSARTFPAGYCMAHRASLSRASAAAHRMAAAGGCRLADFAQSVLEAMRVGLMTVREAQRSMANFSEAMQHAEREHAERVALGLDRPPTPQERLQQALQLAEIEAGAARAEFHAVADPENPVEHRTEGRPARPRPRVGRDHAPDGPDTRPDPEKTPHRPPVARPPRQRHRRPEPALV